MACTENGERVLVFSERASAGAEFSLHYLLTRLQRNKEAVGEGFQVSERFLQMMQGVCVGQFRVPGFLHVVFRISFPRLLNKMFDYLNGLLGHLLPCLHRQLQHRKGPDQ